MTNTIRLKITCFCYYLLAHNSYLILSGRNAQKNDTIGNTINAITLQIFNSILLHNKNCWLKAHKISWDSGMDLRNQLLCKNVDKILR